MAERLKSEFNLDVTLIEGSAGVFDVVADGKLIFSKRSAGRFPDEQEIVEYFRN